MDYYEKIAKEVAKEEKVEDVKEPEQPIYKYVRYCELTYGKNFARGRRGGYHPRIC